MGFSRFLCQETVWIGGQVGMSFQIDSIHEKGGIWEFVNNADWSGFLKRKLLRSSVYRYWYVKSSGSHKWIDAHTWILRASNLFLQCRKYHTLHWIGGFPSSEGNNGIGEDSVRTSELLGGDVDRTHFMVDSVARMQFFGMVRRWWRRALVRI